MKISVNIDDDVIVKLLLNDDINAISEILSSQEDFIFHLTENNIIEKCGVYSIDNYKSVQKNIKKLLIKIFENTLENESE